MTAFKRKLLIHPTLCAVLLFSGLLASFSVAEPIAAATGAQPRIVYLDRDNNIWAARTGGSEAVKLTEQGGFSNVHPTPDGSRILAVGPHNGGSGVYLIGNEPGFSSRLVARGRLPTWSPDYTRFAFSQEGEIHVISRDGDYHTGAGTGANVLKWSPDGTRIGFARNIIDPYGSGCAVRQLGWIDAASGVIEGAGAMIGDFAWTGDGAGLLHVSAGDGAIRSRSVIDGEYTLLSQDAVNSCRAPFFTTADGERLIGLRRFDSGASDLVAINLESGEERVFTDVPVDFPSAQIPDAYVTGDQTGRYIYLARSFPTDIHRLDLQTGEISSILTNDWRRVIGFSPAGDYYALLHTPTGRPLEMTMQHIHGGATTIQNVGWMSWNPSLIDQSAALAWKTNWAREDRPVAAGEPRTWLWGPDYFDVRVEEYDEGPDGFRAVRYYDKSRMEITNPAADREDEWYVTNGLLVRELITGEMQVGDQHVVEREPANVPVAGDEDDPDSPTYATLQGVLGAPAAEVGQEITRIITRDGSVGDGGPGGIAAAHYVPESGHTVADVFWDYLNSSGPIWDGARVDDGRMFQPTFFATGFPITEAYWADVRIGGIRQQVLIQCFERRCLTFAPGNPEGWQVEMGNVGRHYHAWRYP